jgi:hypothetical protein
MTDGLPSIDDALEETVRDERHDTLLGPEGPTVVRSPPRWAATSSATGGSGT